MTSVQETAKPSKDELIWLDVKTLSGIDKAKSKGWTLYLVPFGCIATAGILGRGLYLMFKGDSLKQQMFMRYRVLAQGITLGIATAGILITTKEN